MGIRHGIAIALLAACGSTYRRLPPEAAIPDLRALAEANTALPSEEGFVPVDGFRLAYRHTRKAKGDRLVVLVHGILSDSRTWRYVAGDLGQHHDLLLIDLLGCGRSDKPSGEAVGPNGYSPTALARHVLLAIRARSKTERITLVGHSLGSMVMLRVLGSNDLHAEFGDVLDRVECAVLLSSIDFAGERTHPTFESIEKLPGFAVGLANALGMLREEVAKSTYHGAGDPARMPREEADRTIEILTNGPTRRAGQEMIRQAIPFTPERRPDWPKIEKLVADYRNVSVPTLLIWGGRDETFPVAMGYKLRAQLPNAWLLILKRRMHQLPSGAPLECARQVRIFIAEQGKNRPRIVD